MPDVHDLILLARLLLLRHGLWLVRGLVEFDHLEKDATFRADSGVVFMIFWCSAVRALCVDP